MGKPYKLAVKAVILDDEGRCLLIRRSKSCRNFVGQWEWPGGKLDEGEDFASATLRETREETALEVEITGLGGAASFEMSQMHIVLLCMEARVKCGTVSLSGEHDHFAWVPLRDLPKWSLTEHVRGFMLEFAARKAEERQASDRPHSELPQGSSDARR
jgi:8-oxo-dGTP diphosphatase